MLLSCPDGLVHRSVLRPHLFAELGPFSFYAYFRQKESPLSSYAISSGGPLAHRASAAARAICLRRLGLRDRARALPPALCVFLLIL